MNDAPHMECLVGSTLPTKSLSMDKENRFCNNKRNKNSRGECHLENIPSPPLPTSLDYSGLQLNYAIMNSQFCKKFMFDV